MSKSTSVAFLEDFEAAWKLYPRHYARLEALEKYGSRRREGVPAEELLRAVVNYADHVSRNGIVQAFVMHGGTFFGKKRRWEDYLNPAPIEEPPDKAKAKKCFYKLGGCRATWAELKHDPTCRWCYQWLKKLTPPEEKKQ
jgi:hypothetical protein